MFESLTKLQCEIDDSTTLQIAHLVNRHLKKTFPASQPFICEKFRENLKTLRVALQSNWTLSSQVLSGETRFLRIRAYASPPTQVRGREEGEDEAQDASETASMLPAMFTPKNNSRYALT